MDMESQTYLTSKVGAIDVRHYDSGGTRLTAQNGFYTQVDEAEADGRSVWYKNEGTLLGSLDFPSEHEASVFAADVNGDL